jgi:3-keto-5-aminohexanoate cleavage enzyme
VTPPLIVNLAPTGMVPTRETAPHVPLTTEEILADVAACAELGASIVHVHARDGDGAPTHRAEAFAPIVDGIRAIDPELIVCVTCSGRHVTSLEERAEVLSLDVDMASLTLGSNNFMGQASLNAPDVIRGLAEAMKRRGILPELEVFEPGMVGFGRRLAEDGVLPERCYVNVLLGSPWTAPLTPAVLAAFLSEVPREWTWALAGIGRFQLDAVLLSLGSGGHVRIGMEDNPWLDRDRTRPATNAALLKRVAALAELAERPLATPAQTRELLGL